MIRQPVHDDEVGFVEVSFVVHLWLEDHERPAWRGRITDSDGKRSAFEDGRSLLGIIRSRLLKVSDVTLPETRDPQ